MADKRSSQISTHQLPEPFEEIEHTADNALKVIGSDFAELLVNAARGMNSLMTAVTEEARWPEEKLIRLEALDREGLLVEWLSELAFWAETESIVFSEFEMHSVTSTRLTALVRGNRIGQLIKHIKAVTYHNLEIVPTAEGLAAVVVFDV